MLRKFFLLMLIVFLAACSPTNKVPLGAVSTAAPIPALEKQITPTVSPSPTTVPVQPLILILVRHQQRNSGFTLGKYTHQELNKTMTYLWTETDAKGNVLYWHPEFGEWMRNITTDPDGVPLAVYTTQALNAGLTDQIRLHVAVAEGVPGAAHVGSVTFNDAVRDDTNPADFTSVVFYDLQMAIEKRMGLTLQEYIQMSFDQKHLAFTTSEGSQDWKMGPDTMIIVDILDKPVGNGFQVWKDVYGVQMQSRIFTDAAGNLHVWIVPGKSVDQMTKEQLARIILFGPASVIGSEDQTSQGESSELETLVAFSTDANRHPSIIFGPSQ